MHTRRKTALRKDIRRSFAKSKGRFFSIVSLIALGSFALVGLQVTGPDMRQTAADYFESLNIADVTIIGDLGIDENDVAVIDRAEGAACIEYGYLKDVTIRDSLTSVRVFSATPTLSQYEVVEGRMPQTEDEIAVAAFLDGVAVGDTITFDEAEDSAGDTVLRHSAFTVVGRVHSVELLSAINLGQSTAGTGELNAYAVVTPEAFDSDVYMLARLSFSDTDGVDPYSDEYTALVQAHKDALNTLLADQPALRLQTVQAEYRQEIDDGQAEVDNAKQELADAETELADARAALDDGYAELADGCAELDDARLELADRVAEAQGEIDANSAALDSAAATLRDSEQALADAKPELDRAESTLNEKEQLLNAAKAELAGAQATLTDTQHRLEEAAEQLSANKAALDAAKAELDAKKPQLEEAEAQLESNRSQLNDAEARLTEAEAQLNTARTTLDETKAQLDAGRAELDAGQAQLDEARTVLDAQWDEALNAAVSAATDGAVCSWAAAYDSRSAAADAVRAQAPDALAALDAAEPEYAAAADALAQKQEQFDAAQAQYQQGEAAYSEQLAEYNAGQAAYQQNLAAYQSGQAAYEQALAQYNAGLAQYEEGLTQYSAAEAAYQAGRAQYEQGLADCAAGEATYTAGLRAWEAGWQTLREKTAEYYTGLQQVQNGRVQIADGQAKLEEARQTLADEKAQAEQEIADGERELADARQELADGEAEYADKLAEYNDKRPDAEADIADAEQTLAEARESLDALSAPVYALDTRREIPGAEGYKIYGTVSDIVDALADVFPVFLYLVAALVTLTTMTRFVDEERMNNGTLKALGYTDRDIMKKFLRYGTLAGLAGAAIGITAGHILIPLIVYNAYGHSFTYPAVELHFYPAITALALLLALLSAALPAYAAAARELRNTPAALLRPKAPAAGSKILLERVTPLWNRLSFTHKVTARNIFRYKKRMLMTVFGVCGAVTLLFAGFSVQHAIAGVNDRQFGEILQYDLIAARGDAVTDAQDAEIEALLASDDVERELPIVYEEMSKTAGKQNDKQSIKLIVPQSTAEFSDYVQLADRRTGAAIALPDDGAVLSERLADLLDVQPGDTVTLTDADSTERTLRVAAVTEMYTGHFVFLSEAYYIRVFGQAYAPNAYLVTLADRSADNANRQAARFLALDGISGVVQNTTLMNQIDTIVRSLNKIMEVLILAALLLGAVILYNLTNINVSERIRELCTIKVLGFHDKEVTLYIYRETILLTVLGVLAGFGLGDALYRYILAVVPPDEVMFNPALGVKAFAVPVLAVSLITLALGLVIHRRLQKVDMLEALKSVD